MSLRFRCVAAGAFGLALLLMACEGEDEGGPGAKKGPPGEPVTTYSVGDAALQNPLPPGAGPPILPEAGPPDAGSDSGNPRDASGTRDTGVDPPDGASDAAMGGDT